jgi:hypothetical protein
MSDPLCALKQELGRRVARVVLERAVKTDAWLREKEKTRTDAWLFCGLPVSQVCLTPDTYKAHQYAHIVHPTRMSREVHALFEPARTWLSSTSLQTFVTSSTHAVIALKQTSPVSAALQVRSRLGKSAGPGHDLARYRRPGFSCGV